MLVIGTFSLFQKQFWQLFCYPHQTNQFAAKYRQRWISWEGAQMDLALEMCCSISLEEWQILPRWLHSQLIKVCLRFQFHYGNMRFISCIDCIKWQFLSFFTDSWVNFSGNIGKVILSLVCINPRSCLPSSLQYWWFDVFLIVSHDIKLSLRPSCK